MPRGAALLLATSLALAAGVSCGAVPRAQVSAPSAGHSSAAGLDPANALTSYVQGGSPGDWIPSRVVGTHFQVPCLYNYGKCFDPTILVRGAPVGRSPATAGEQTVLLTTRVASWDKVFNSWVLDKQETQAMVIPAGAGSASYVDRSWLLNPGGPRSVIFLATWSDELGRDLGWRIVAMNQRDDYVCETSFTSACGVYDGFITVVQPF